MKRYLNTGRGFTLVEMIVVLMIVATLSGMMAFAASSAVEKAQQTATTVAVNAVRRAIDLGFTGSNSSGAGTIIYNINNYKPHLTPEEAKILNAILEYLNGSDVKKIGMYIHTMSPKGYYIFYYPRGVVGEKPYYFYDSNQPDKGAVRVAK